MIYQKINNAYCFYHKEQIIKIFSERIKIILGATFGFVFGFTIGEIFDYSSLGIGFGVVLGIVVVSKIKKGESFNKKNQISGEVAKAMASKIIFEAEQHRKNRDKYNYMKINSDDEGQIFLYIHRECW